MVSDRCREERKRGQPIVLAVKMLLPLSTKRQFFKEHDLVSIETALPLFNLFSAGNLDPGQPLKSPKSVTFSVRNYKSQGVVRQWRL